MSPFTHYQSSFVLGEVSISESFAWSLFLLSVSSHFFIHISNVFVATELLRLYMLPCSWCHVHVHVHMVIRLLVNNEILINFFNLNISVILKKSYIYFLRIISKIVSFSIFILKTTRLFFIVKNQPSSEYICWGAQTSSLFFYLKYVY